MDASGAEVTIGLGQRIWDALSCRHTMKEILRRINNIESRLDSPSLYLDQMELTEKSLKATIDLIERQKKDVEDKNGLLLEMLEKNLKLVESMREGAKLIINKNAELEKQLEMYRPVAAATYAEGLRRKVEVNNPLQKALESRATMLGSVNVVRPVTLNDMIARAKAVKENH